jgi:hypothetical protein
VRLTSSPQKRGESKPVADLWSSSFSSSEEIAKLRNLKALDCHERVIFSVAYRGTSVLYLRDNTAAGYQRPLDLKRSLFYAQAAFS